MTAKKAPAKHETILNTVARKLGHAAGTLTNVTREVTENLSTVPETVATGVRQLARIGKLAKHPRTLHAKKKIRRASSAGTSKSAASADKRRPRRSKSSNSSRKPGSRQP